MTTLYAVLLGCLRKALSRMLVLIVAMGFGVVLPYLGAVQKQARRCCATSYSRGVTWVFNTNAMQFVLLRKLLASPVDFAAACLSS